MNDPFPDIKAAPDYQASRDVTGEARPTDPYLAELWGLRDSDSGIVMDDRAALTLSAFFSGVALICEAMGVMPLKVFKERKSGGWDYQDQHPTNYCLGTTNNGWQTPTSYKSCTQAHLIMAGNGVSSVTRNGRGQGIGLKSFLPVNSRYYVNPDGNPSYHLRDYPIAETENLLYTAGSWDTSFYEYDFSEVCHFKAFGLSPYLGTSVLSAARSSLSLTKTIDIFGTKFFNKGRPAGFLTRDGKLTEQQIEVLKNEWAEFQEGIRNAFNVGILSGGLKWEAIGYTNDDAQFLQSRDFQVLEIARWLRIPPHMLAQLDKATNSNIEVLMLEFITFTLLPWITKWEEELNLKMFTPKEKSMGFCCLFDVDAFLRGDSRARAEVAEKNIRNGVTTIEEERLLLRKNPYPNGIGSKPLIIASQLDDLSRVIDGKSLLQGYQDPAVAAAKSAAKSQKKAASNAEKNLELDTPTGTLPG